MNLSRKGRGSPPVEVGGFKPPSSYYLYSNLDHFQLMKNKPKSDLIPMSVVAKAVDIPISTMSNFVRRGLKSYPHPTDQRKKLINIGELASFLRTDAAGKYRGSAIKILAEASAAGTPQTSTDAVGATAVPVFLAPDALNQETHPPKPETTTGSSMPMSLPATGVASVAQQPAALACLGGGKNRRNADPRPPGQLKRFKREARRLAYAEIAWGVRYLLSRADHIHDTEMRKLRDESRARQRAHAEDETMVANSGVLPPREERAA